MLAHQNARPDLVFLAACESAKSATGDAFRGIAQQVVQAGVPAVVAMQGSVSMVTARQFSAECYRGLLRHGVVDLAVNQARSVLLSEECPDALLPVLFMRLRDGKVWVW
jgi:CHAT domain-containing protein